MSTAEVCEGARIFHDCDCGNSDDQSRGEGSFGPTGRSRTSRERQGDDWLRIFAKFGGSDSHMFS